MLCEDMALQTAATAVFPVTLNVVTQWGDEFQFSVNDRKIADDVKALVERKTGVERCNQFLTMDGHRVKSEANLMSLGASQDSCVRVYAGRGSQGTMKLRLRSLAEEEKCIQVDPMQTILECKELYEKLTEIPCNHVEFVYNGQVMENNLSLLDYKATANSIIYVVFRHFPIFIWTNKHKFYCLRVNAKSTISEIKTKIYEHEGIEIKEQRLAYKDFEMEDDKELAYYHAAKPNAVYRLIIRDEAMKVTQIINTVNDQRQDVLKKAPAEHCTLI
ncbi:uncharacterized protein [Ptychodera flava]|uniref:uncharacterized protein n=1 Tax=Ptychodera flava TaxID=63121 RepID=UPI00396A2152